MADLASLLFPDVETNNEFEQVLTKSMLPWWGDDASYAAGLIIEAIGIAEARTPPTSRSHDYVGELIAFGEVKILEFQVPST